MANSLESVQFAGSVHGGQQPVSGSHVYLYAAGSGSYGAASTSLLGTGTTLSGLTQDASLNYYATTDSNGNFTITGNYSCPSSSAQVYALAVGGNPGMAAGTNNTAITLLAAIGSCSTLSAASNIVINEASTAASVTALQQFMVDDVHIGAPTTNVTGLQNAFLAVTNLYTIGTGAVRSTPVSGSGSSPQAKVNTLGNILAPCVNSTGPTSTACSSLFAAATPSGTKPSDIAATMLMIAKNPGYNPTGLFQQINTSAPFAPALTSAPNDFTLAVTFTGGGLMLPGDVIIDASGNAWTANCPTCAGVTGTDSIVGFSPLGAVLTGTSGFTSGIHRPQGIAFDESGNLWSVDDATSTLPDQIVKMNATTGADATGFPFSNASVDSPLGIAIDATGNAWISNQGNSVVLEVSTAGVQVGSPYSNSMFVSPTGIGIDGSGNVFAAGTASSNIFKVNSGSIYSGAGLAQPLGISLDHSGNIWTLNNQANTLSVLSNTGAAVTSGVGNGFTQAAVIAIDGAGTGWSANCRQTCGNPNSPDNLLHYNVSAQSLTVSDGFQDSHLSTAGTAAIDLSGNVWVSNNSGASLTEFLGVAEPVKTPLAAAVAANQLGTRP